MEIRDNSSLLAQRCAAGDRRALDELLVQNLPGLRAFVRLQAGPLLRAKESSSDLVQSVCREVLEGLDAFTYTSEAAFKQWLYETTLHKLIDRNRYYRAAKRDAAREAHKLEELDGKSLMTSYRTFCTPSRGAVLSEEIERIEQAFDKLSTRDREVITLAHIVGLTYREIADRTQRTEAAVRNALHRALARLSGYLLANKDPGAAGS